MIEHADAALLVERLRVLDRFPAYERGPDELILAVMAAANGDVAALVINNFIDYQKECPKPSEIRKQIWEENEKVKPRQTQRAVQVPSRVAEKQAAAAERYMELIGLQREGRRLNPKLAEIGPDGMCPRTAITQEMESKWAEAGMGHR